jgi:hypothetical protein
MVNEYRDAKTKEKDLELKVKQYVVVSLEPFCSALGSDFILGNRLAAQLARTEEAAKRALVRTDVTARGGAAQRLLESETALQKLREENAELHRKLARCVVCSHWESQHASQH